MKRTKLLISTESKILTAYSVRFSASKKTIFYTDYKNNEHKISTSKVYWIA